MKYLLIPFTILLFLPASAGAEEKQPVEEPAVEKEAEKKAGFTYSPDHCEFEVIFPDEAYTSRRCEDAEKTKCYDLVSYTQVFELSSTVNFRVICNPVDKSLYDDYSAEVMSATLRAMTKNSIVEEYKSAYREAEGYKQAGLVGEGKTGRTSTIYIAQLWIGKQSAFSVEAELIGEQENKADALFSSIMKTVRYSGIKDLPEPKKTVPPTRD